MLTLNELKDTFIRDFVFDEYLDCPGSCQECTLASAFYDEEIMVTVYCPNRRRCVDIVVCSDECRRSAEARNIALYGSDNASRQFFDYFFSE